MASPSPSNIDQSIRKRGSNQIVEEEPMKKWKTGEDGVESSSGKGGEDSDDRFPLSHVKPKNLVRRKKVSSKKTFDVSSANVGGKDEKSCEGAKGGKGSPKGSSGKNMPLPQVCKVTSSGNPSVLLETNWNVVLSNDDSDNDEVDGSGERGGEQNQFEDSINDAKGHASRETDPITNIESKPPMNQSLVGVSMSGADCDSLASFATLASSSFRSLTVDQMLQAVPLYGPSMNSSLKLVAENYKLLEAAIHQKKLEEMGHFRTKLQVEQHLSRELQKHLNKAKAEISSLERDCAFEYNGLCRKLKDGEGLVARLQQKIRNKDGKIDRQASVIEELQAELTRYQSFEYVPEEMDNLRAEVSRLQRVASDWLLLNENLEGQCNSLRLRNWDLHADRKRLLRLKDEAEISVQKLEEKLRRFDHKKHCPSNDMALKMCELDTSLFKPEETLKLALPAISAEQGKVKALEEQVVQLKQNEAVFNTKLSNTAVELTRQLDEAQKKHDMELTPRDQGVCEGIY